MIPFDSSTYGEEVQAILAIEGAGARRMPLAPHGTCHPEGRNRLAGRSARDLFPAARHPDAALSGLWLYFSCLDESHTLSQDIPSVEGSFWHGIMHRQEPDPGNSGYWFRRVGSHPIFPQLRDAAADLAQGSEFHVGSTWDPFAFIDLCETARRKPGSAAESLAIDIQIVEWQLLFDWCARPKS